MSHRIPLLILLPALAACGSAPNVGKDTSNIVEHPLDYIEYDVRFTNPLCDEYKYAPEDHVQTTSGEPLIAKPKGAYCTLSDRSASASRADSPQSKLLEWINDPDTKELFMAYLSFSNSSVKNALCKGVRERGLKVTMVLDNTSDTGAADFVASCAPADMAPEARPRVELRGHQGGIDFAHNKVFIVNGSEPIVRIAFSSGNMTSGTVLHHENWSFVTLRAETYFARAHLCLEEGALNHAESSDDYAAFITQCRAEIPYPEETDVKTFFIPGEGGPALAAIESAALQSETMLLGAHRFGYPELVDVLERALRRESPPRLSMIFDDDMYWLTKGLKTGDNESWELGLVNPLVQAGALVKYVQTNEGPHLLHHNKFIIFNPPTGSSTKPAVFYGAGNLTDTAFLSNFENFYFVTIPKVVEAFNAQYAHLWNDLATDEAHMPSENVKPVTH